MQIRVSVHHDEFLSSKRNYILENGKIIVAGVRTKNSIPCEILGNLLQGNIFVYIYIFDSEFLTVCGVTDDKHIGAVAGRSWRRKSTRLQRSKRGDVGSYLVVAAACSTDFERLAVPCTTEAGRKSINSTVHAPSVSSPFKLPNCRAIETLATSSKF